MKENKLIVIDKDLRKAYESANYRVFEPAVLFNIGAKNNQLKQLLSQSNSNQAFFISAFNPKSKLLTETANNYRHIELENKLHLSTYSIHEGIGEDPTDKWPGELSFLVMNISKEAIIEIAHFFKQLAILEINKEGVAQLLWLI